MTRLEENQILINEIIKKMETKPIGTYEETIAFQLGIISITLSDISKILAILADKAESEENK